MNNEMREKIMSFLSLHNNKLGVVSTINEDNNPASAYVYFAFDENLNIYFVTRDSSRKFKNIMRNDHVAFAIISENPPQTLQIEGTAKVHNEKDAQKHLFEELVGRASARNFSAPIAQMKMGGLQFIKINPTWMRFGNFEARKHGGIFEEVKVEK